MTDRPIPPQQGDEAQLYRDLSCQLLHAVRSSVIAPDAVIEDACSFAWLQLLRCQPRRDAAFAWLTKVAIREGWRLAKQARRDHRLELLPEDDERRHEPIDTELRMRARDALETLAALPPRQRTYVSMLIAGHTYDEISTATGSSRTIVNKHLARASKTLRTCSHA